MKSNEFLNNDTKFIPWIAENKKRLFYIKVSTQAFQLTNVSYTLVSVATTYIFQKAKMKTPR